MKIPDMDGPFRELVAVLTGYEVEDGSIKENREIYAVDAMNTSHTVMLKARFCQDPDVELRTQLDEGFTDPNGEIGVDFTRLSKIFNSYGKNAVLELRGEDGEVIVEGDTHSTTFKEITLDEVETPYPDLDYSEDVKIEADISEALRAAGKIYGRGRIKDSGEDMRLNSENGSINLAYSDEISDFSYHIAGSNGKELDTGVNSKFLAPLKNTWTYHLKQDIPVKAERSISSENWKAMFRVLIAPVVETEEPKEVRT